MPYLCAQGQLLFMSPSLLVVCRACTSRALAARVKPLRLALILLLLLHSDGVDAAKKGKKAKQQQAPPGKRTEFVGLNSENMPASSIKVEGGGTLPKDAPTPKFKQIREEDIPPGAKVKTVHDGDLLDLTNGQYDDDKKRKVCTRVLHWLVCTKYT